MPSNVFTLIMHVSRNTSQLKPVQQLRAREYKISQRDHWSDSDSDNGVTLDTLRSPLLLTLSPRLDNKLALKYENVEHIRLAPATRVDIGGVIVNKPVCTLLRHLCSPLNTFNVIKPNMRFLNDEKDSLISKKILLKEKISEEQIKNVKLRMVNENLKVNLSVFATRLLALSVDKESLQEELQKLTWHWNYNKFLLPLQRITFYQKL